MTSITHFVGLDVHKDTIALAVAQTGRTAPSDLGQISSDGHRLLKKLDRLGARENLLCCYEAGPTGYALFRFLKQHGVACQVIAPSLVPDRKGDRVKTDRRDARKLARFLRSGDLTPVWVPDEETEALRDLFRARDDAKICERSARHRLGKFLLRHGRVYGGRTAWTAMHLDWIRKQRFEHESQNEALREYLHAVESQTEAVARLTAAIERMIQGSSLEPLARALQALKGFRVVSAVGLAVELGDLRRFRTAPDLMSYVGLGVAEDSTGKQRRQFSITKAGNSHVRRLLVESAWSYRHPPKLSAHLRKRAADVGPEIKEIAWKAQHRLNHRFRRLVARGKSHQVAIVAVARELAGFVWAIGQRVEVGKG